MRRFIAAVFSLAVVLGLAAFADAQFRRPVRAPQAPIRFNPFVFNNVPPFNAFTASSFVTFQTPRGAFAPAVPGAFDPRTRTFVPSATGAATLTSRASHSASGVSTQTSTNRAAWVSPSPASAERARSRSRRRGAVAATSATIPWRASSTASADSAR